MTRDTAELTERAEAEVDQIYLRLGRDASEAARRWYAGFYGALASLSSLPNRCPAARENSAFPDVTVRQLLYGKHRLLFHVIEPDAGELMGVVRVLHILHGAQMFPRQGAEDD